MLTHTVSLTLQRTMNVTIHNQYPVIELVSPIYFCNYGSYYEYPVERTGTDAGSVMKINFKFDPNQKKSGGILMYKIQRKVNTRSIHQSNVDPIYAKVVEETLEMIRLLVIWRVKDHVKPRAKVIFVEHDNELVLNEDKLAQLYNEIIDMAFIYNRGYLSTKHRDLCDFLALFRVHTALEASYKVEWQCDLGLKINILKDKYAMKDEHTMKPMWIDPKR
jgi:hypothetical protein